jgi:DNA-binding transcriptional regulator YdaS (Cro superfamily)
MGCRITLQLLQRYTETMPSATPPENIEDNGLRQAVAKMGSINALAKVLGMSAQSVSVWRRIPSHRILQVEAVTGIRREELRPDLYNRRV